MNQVFESTHWTDRDGNPSGGISTGLGVTVAWQNGPLGRGDDRQRPNGAFVETVIAIAVDRLNHYQSSKFACDENAKAIESLLDAMRALNKRTERREVERVEGTHVV